MRAWAYDLPVRRTHSPFAQYAMHGAIGPTFGALFNSFARRTLHGEGVVCVTRSSGVCAGKQKPTQREAESQWGLIYI